MEAADVVESVVASAVVAKVYGMDFVIGVLVVVVAAWEAVGTCAVVVASLAIGVGAGVDGCP